MISLTLKERFMRVFEFKDVDNVPNYEFGFWGETIKRWHKEGLPPSLYTSREIERYLGLEGFHSLEMIPVNTGLCPMPKIKIEEFKALGRVVIKDEIGGVYLSPIETSSPATNIKYPLTDKESWKMNFKPRLNPDSTARFPPDISNREEREVIMGKEYLSLGTSLYYHSLQLPWIHPSKPIFWNELVEAYKNRNYPLGIFVGSLYGWLRNWMGVERLSVAFYRDPDWIAEMMDDLVNLWIGVLKRILRDIKPDCSLWWEDMASNEGPLLSPSLFEEFMVPRYRRVIKLLEENNVKVHIVDCDGNIHKLVQGWLNAGINCMMPVEARASNALKLREEFGRKILFIGCINKFAIMDGEKSIEKEFNRLTPLLEDGGFIPMIDHQSPTEISYKEYLNYLRHKQEWIHKILQH